MLFHVTWEFIDTSEDGVRRSLAAFQQWQPPAGAEFKGFYGYTDGTGGVALIEVDSATTLWRTTAPWVPWLRFDVIGQTLSNPDNRLKLLKFLMYRQAPGETGAHAGHQH